MARVGRPAGEVSDKGTRLALLWQSHTLPGSLVCSVWTSSSCRHGLGLQTGARRDSRPRHTLILP